MPSRTFKGLKQVGTFYWEQKAGDKNPDRYDYRFCGGTVVPSPGKNLIASAAHCFDNDDQKENLVFVPQHSAANPMPHGLFPIKKGSIFKDPGRGCALLAVWSGGRGGSLLRRLSAPRP